MPIAFFVRSTPAPVSRPLAGSSRTTSQAVGDAFPWRGRLAARLAAFAVLAVVAGFGGQASAAPPAPRPAPAPKPLAAPATDYAVRLSRAAAVGEKRLAVGWLQSDDHLSGTRDGEPSDQRQTATIRYVVTTAVEEVSPRGNVQRATLTVRRLVKESGGVTLELAKPGSLVTAHLAGHERIFELMGARLAPDLQQALAAAMPLRADDEPTDDDLFGTAARRRAGESWPANGELFAAFGAASLTFDPKAAAGTVTLAAVKPVNGQPCLDVRWKLEAKNGALKPGSLPPGFSGRATSMTVSGSALVPADAALPAAGRDTSIAVIAEISGESVGGASSSLHHELRQVAHVEFSKIP